MKNTLLLISATWKNMKKNNAYKNGKSWRKLVN